MKDASTGRAANNPKRRIAPKDKYTESERERLAANATYAGSGHHKRRPGDYGFDPPVNPRPHKTLCDVDREFLRGEARVLMAAGIAKGMFSEFGENGLPKYIWSVSEDGEAFEAKTKPERDAAYHGYPLQVQDAMREFVLKEWKKR